MSKPKSLALRIGLALSLLLASGVAICMSFPSSKPQTNVADQFPKCFGALALSESGTCVNNDLEGFYPSLKDVPTDVYFAKNKCKHLILEEWKPVRCQIGVAGGKIRIAMVGDSHVAQYTGAIKLLAKVHNWSVDVYAKGACPLTDALVIGENKLSVSCQKWIAATKQMVVAGKYDLILTSRKSIDEGENLLSAEEKQKAELETASLFQTLAQGSELLVIKDNPRPKADFLDCLAKDNQALCSTPESSAYRFDPQVRAVSALNQDNVQLLAFDKFFCQSGSCSPVIGHVVIYKDDNHLTNTFVKSLATVLESKMLEVLPKP